jgi:NDP-hexose C3-ketoreductase / dTDP-4-oxo-2-deoxy-alpha-D-pentos-2-ene 2,3-reductase
MTFVGVTRQSGATGLDPAAEHDRFYTRLGRTGLRISRLALGTVNFGGRVEEPEAHRLMDHALARGINLVDTANMYGWRVHKGHTEEVIGRWLAASPARRDDVVLATKVGNEMGSGLNDQGLSARHVIAACEASLRRLGTDWIDLYQMHRVDHASSWDEVWQAMEQLVGQGKVRYVGSSNFAGWNLAAAQESARNRHFLGVVSEQCGYNLVTRFPELEVLPAARAYGIAVLVWSPLHGGLLGGVIRKLAEGTAVKSAQGRAAAELADRRDVIAEYERFCDEIGREPAQVGLSWVLSRPGVTGVVIGPRTQAHVDGAIEALESPLSEAQLARLDAMFPPVGRGGLAPHAWIS